MMVFLLSSKWFNKLDEISSLGFTHCYFHTHTQPFDFKTTFLGSYVFKCENVSVGNESR